MELKSGIYESLIYEAMQNHIPGFILDKAQKMAVG